MLPFLSWVWIATLFLSHRASLFAVTLAHAHLLAGVSIVFCLSFSLVVLRNCRLQKLLSFCCVFGNFDRLERVVTGVVRR